MATKKNAERDEAIATLREVAPPGTTIYAIIRSVARSGMSRTIDLYVLDVGPEGKPFPRYVSNLFARARGWKQDKRGALKVSGCGMDMVFHVLYETAGVVHPGRPNTWRREVL